MTPNETLRHIARVTDAAIALRQAVIQDKGHPVRFCECAIVLEEDGGQLCWVSLTGREWNGEYIDAIEEALSEAGYSPSDVHFAGQPHQEGELSMDCRGGVVTLSKGKKLVSRWSNQDLAAKGLADLIIGGPKRVSHGVRVALEAHDWGVE